MKLSAKTKDCSLIIKVKTTAQEKIDEKELDRFARVYLRSFLKPTEIGRNSAKYTGPMGITLKARLEKEITKRDFLFIIEYIVNAVQKLKANNFPVCNLDMDIQNIFINETTKEMQFLYVPLTGRQESSNVIKLLSSVVYLARPAAENDTDYVSRFNYFMKSLKPFDINTIEQFIQREDFSVVNTVKKHNAGQSGFMTSNHKRYYDHMDAQKKAQEEANNLSAMPIGATTPEEDTALLTEQRQLAGHDFYCEQTANPTTGFTQPASQRVSAEEATGLLTDYEQAANPGGNFGQPTAPEYGFGYTASPATGFTQPASQHASAEEATGLLTDYEQAANRGGNFGQPTAPECGFGYTASPAIGFTQPASQHASAEEATGLLTDYEQAANRGGNFGQPTAPEYGFGCTASPATGFTPPVSQYASAEEATGLLAEAPRASGYFKNPVRDPLSSVFVDDNATTLLVEEDTVLISNANPKMVYPELYRKNTGEAVKVNKPVFRIGKERSYVDYFVTNNNAVSRSHADIITRSNGYFIIDLNSTNKTYINNRAIPVQTETEIKDGDLVRLGNEEFIFKIVASHQVAQLQYCPWCKAQLRQGSIFCHSCGRKVRNESYV